VQELDYEPPRGHVSEINVVVLCVLPPVAFPLWLLTGMLAVAEPFMVLRVRHVAVFVGVPVAIAAFAIVWAWLAFKHRVRRVVMVLVLAWFALLAYGATQELLWYLREPWNS
jgi:hypothetical protein